MQNQWSWQMNASSSLGSFIISLSFYAKPTSCSSSVRNNSLDASSMLLPNGSYSINANDCIRCSCDALSCEASQLRPTTWPTCPPTRCPGGESLFLGNTTSTSYANNQCKQTTSNGIGARAGMPAPGFEPWPLRNLHVGCSIRDRRPLHGEPHVDALAASMLTSVSSLDHLGGARILG
ncbi:hypothetical protein YC2023_051592 [Brassica napus]